jgi:hypothetical protein
MNLSDLIEHLTSLREAHGELDLYAYIHHGADPAPVEVLVKYDSYDEATYVELHLEFGEDA